MNLKITNLEKGTILTKVEALKVRKVNNQVMVSSLWVSNVLEFKLSYLHQIIDNTFNKLNKKLIKHKVDINNKYELIYLLTEEEVLQVLVSLGNDVKVLKLIPIILSIKTINAPIQVCSNEVEGGEVELILEFEDIRPTQEVSSLTKLLDKYVPNHKRTMDINKILEKEGIIKTYIYEPKSKTHKAKRKKFTTHSNYYGYNENASSRSIFPYKVQFYDDRFLELIESLKSKGYVLTKT